MNAARALALWVVGSIPVAAMSLPAASDEFAIDWTDVERKVLPRADELEYRDIGWRVSLWEALKEAQREKKPVLLWAMNGHPLGCT
jgi:hypothetical protein